MSWAIIVHGDTDGLCAGTLLARAFGGEVWFSRPVSLLHDLSNFDGKDVVIADIAVPYHERYTLAKELERIASRNRLIYIDHHPIPEGIEIPGEVIHDLNRSSSELAYSLVKDMIPREFVKIALYGAIADYSDETPWVVEELEHWDKRIIYFQSGMLSQGMGEAQHRYEFKRNLIKEFLRGREPSEIDELVRLALEESLHDKDLYNDIKRMVKVEKRVAYAIIERGSLSKGAHFALGMTNSTIGICGKIEGNKIDMSIRAEKHANLDLNRIIREITEKLGGSGGGHRSAAGASVPKDKFKKFVEMLNEKI